jgi:TPP-dependent pyruvate/acetoin dehydrogenase alpha subunit
VTEAEIEAVHSRVEAQFTAAVEVARQEPEPTVADLETEVFAP